MGETGGRSGVPEGPEGAERARRAAVAFLVCSLRAAKLLRATKRSQLDAIHDHRLLVRLTPHPQTKIDTSLFTQHDCDGYTNKPRRGEEGYSLLLLLLLLWLLLLYLISNDIYLTPTEHTCC
jgi:hypothetical protein